LIPLRLAQEAAVCSSTQRITEAWSDAKSLAAIIKLLDGAGEVGKKTGFFCRKMSAKQYDAFQNSRCWNARPDQSPGWPEIKSEIEKAARAGTTSNDEGGERIYISSFRAWF